jgi:cell division protein FtsW (lipid II flippase)
MGLTCKTLYEWMKGIDMKKIYSVISLLLIFLFIFVGNVNSSSDWIQIGTNKDGVVFSYNKENIEKNTEKIRFKYG